MNFLFSFYILLAPLPPNPVPNFLGTSYIGVQSVRNMDDRLMFQNVVQDGPAAKAGAQNGDIIVSFNNFPIKDVSQFSDLVRNVRPGRCVELIVLRQKKELKMKIYPSERFD